MKLLFVGNRKRNSGPENVNRTMVEHFDDTFLYAKATNKYICYIENFIKLLFADAVIVSGISKMGLLSARLAKKLNKKTVYIMHGLSAMEVKLNALKNADDALSAEKELLANSDLLLPVSKKFSDFIKNEFPQYAHKTQYLFNGYNRVKQPTECKHEKEKGFIMAVGGDRKIKNNEPVSCAVEMLNTDAKFEIYGRIHNEIPQTNNKKTRYMNVVPNDEFKEKLKSAQIFVLNSLFETFSLAVLEALDFGCDVLVSNSAGVVDILPLTEKDIIFDTSSVDEIKEKLEYLMSHPNNERILSNTKFDEYTPQKSVERLKLFCRELLSKN